MSYRPHFTCAVGSAIFLVAYMASAADSGVPALPNAPAAAAIGDMNNNALPVMPAHAAADQPAGASMPKTATLPALITDAAAAPAQQSKTYSFGAYPHSIFYTESQVAMMRLALTTAEDRPGVDTQQAMDIKDSAAPPPQEPSLYPVYYLDSIVYRDPNDWAIWISGQKITPKKNPTDLKVVAVDSHQVTFSWAPGYQQALMARNSQNSFAAIAPVKHRAAKEQKINFDGVTAVSTFTLRPNQAFAAGYMSIFEGNLESPSMPPIAIPAQPAAGMPAGADASTMADPNAPAPQGLADDAIRRMAEKADRELPLEPNIP